MLENLDDPHPPAYDPAAVDRRIQDLVARRRHRRQIYGTALVVGALAAGGLAYSATQQRGAVDVVTGPPTTLGSCPTSPARPCPVEPPTTPATSPTNKLPPPPGAMTIPDLVGLDAVTAGQTTKAIGLPADIEAETVTASHPAGTVVAQDPPPGALAAAVALTVAVPDAPPCATGQLEVTFSGAAASAGWDATSLRLRDTSASWCTLSGPVTVIGVDGSGRTDTAVVPLQLLHPIVMSPDAPLPTEDGSNPPLGTIEASIIISAEYRDLASGPDGLCTNQQVAPAAWRITISGGVALTAPNVDPAAVSFKSMLTCQGRLEASGPVQLLSG